MILTSTLHPGGPGAASGQYLTRGSVVVLDELGEERFPGETVALREVFGLGEIKLVHTRYSSNRAYFIHE